MEKQVTFEDKGELLAALVSGRKLVTKDDGYARIWMRYNPARKGNPFILGYVDPDAMFGPYETDRVRFWDSYKSLYEEIEWFEVIPSIGVLCKVWDDDVTAADDASRTIIYSWDERAEYGFKGTAGCWTNAVPLSDEEILAYLPT